MKTYNAPWGKSLKWISALLVVLALISTGSRLYMNGMPQWTMNIVPWILPFIVLCCVPFVVRGYEITGTAILIRRLLWTTRLDRADLRSAEVVPNAMSKCVRTCGNGGGFSFTGWYWSKSLGSFTAYVTDLNRTVVLRFGKRTVVVSPDAPEEFAKELNG